MAPGKSQFLDDDADGKNVFQACSVSCSATKGLLLA